MSIKIKKYRLSKKAYLFSNIVKVSMKKTLLLFICLYSVALFSQDDMFAKEEVNPEEFSELYYSGKKVQVTKPIPGSLSSYKIMSRISEFGGLQRSSDSNGVYFRAEKEYFYTGNGFQYMPRKIEIVIFHHGNVYISSWFPYIPEDRVLDKDGKSRRVFSHIAEYNSELYQIVRVPENTCAQTIPDRELPSVTREGMNTLSRSFELVTGGVEVNFPEEGVLLLGGDKRFTRMTAGSDDKSVMYALGTAWNNMIDFDTKAGEYISERARILSQQNEILRQRILKNSQQGVIIYR